jgi:hypothetical protein
MILFRYLSIGVLCLTLAALIGLHLGSQTAQAQPTEVRYLATDYAGGGDFNVIAILPNGDVYRRLATTAPWEQTDPPNYIGNFWNSAPTPTSSESWGSIKSKGK